MGTSYAATIKLVAKVTNPGIPVAPQVGLPWVGAADLYDEADKKVGTGEANCTIKVLNLPELPTSECKVTLKLPEGEVYMTPTIKYGFKGVPPKDALEPFKAPLSGAMSGEGEISGGAGRYNVTLTTN